MAANETTNPPVRKAGSTKVLGQQLGKQPSPNPRPAIAVFGGNFTEQEMKTKKQTARPTAIPIRPAPHGVSENQLEARRKLGMVWFMNKRDQQEDWG